MAKCTKINKKLLSVKIVMFGWFGATACILPFMTIHMKDLGITVEETAIIYILLPVTQFLASPIAGFIADKLGKYRNVLLLSVFLTVILGTALLYVPPAKARTLQTLFICDSSGLSISQEKCHRKTCPNMTAIDSLRVSQCELMCSNGVNPFRCPDDVCQKYIERLENGTIHLSSKTPDLEEMHCMYQIMSIEWGQNASSRAVNTSNSQLPSNCTVKCKVEVTEGKADETNALCLPSWQNRVLTVWLYSILRIIYNIFSSIGYTLVDSSALAAIEEEGDHYGRQRFWAILATAIFSPLSGYLVDVVSQSQGYITYAPAFYAYNVLALATILASWNLDSVVAVPEGDTLKNLWKLAKMPAVFSLLIVVFWLGTVWGFLESFLFWFLLELGSPTYMLGLTLTVGSLVGLPFLHHSQWIVKKVGHVNILIIALFTYLVRCLGYSYLEYPWWVMIYETMEIFTYHLMWVSAATYSAMLSPPGLLATIQGCVGGIHYGIGQGSGSLIGGYLMSTLGARAAFQVMGGISGGIAVCYALLYVIWLRKSHKRMDEEAHTMRHVIKGPAEEKLAVQDNIKT